MDKPSATDRGPGRGHRRCDPRQDAPAAAPPPSPAGHPEGAALDHHGPSGRLIGKSASWQAVLAEALWHARHSSGPVCLLGETGTGKEQIARYIHEQSPRAKGPLVTENCAALPDSLVLDCLFGHEKGAFTGAGALRKGLFEQAGQGTLLLDEFGELHANHQAALLRVLDGYGFCRVGGSQTLTPDFRLIVATHRDLKAEVEAGRFREDLFYRVGATNPIRIPPLRQRPEDIPLLADSFFRDATGRGPPPTTCWDALLEYAWHGNARQLRGFIEHLASRYGGGLEAGLVVADLALHRQDVPRRVHPSHGAEPHSSGGVTPTSPGGPAGLGGTRQDVIACLCRHLDHLDPAGRAGFLKESFKYIKLLIVESIAAYCTEQAARENARPLDVYQRHFERPRLASRSRGELSVVDRLVKSLLEQAGEAPIPGHASGGGPPS
jgi:transcriptional regulator with GAF, ATPase, and Fis domain